VGHLLHIGVKSSLHRRYNHIHILIYIYSYTYTHIHILIYSYTHILTYTPAICSYTLLLYTHILIYIYTHTLLLYTHILIYSYTHIHILTYTHIYSHTLTHILTYSSIGFDIFLVPIFTLLLPTLKHNGKPTPATWVAVVLSIVGLYLISDASLEDFELGKFICTICTKYTIIHYIH
jgi:hypothetical protein